MASVACCEHSIVAGGSELAFRYERYPVFRIDDASTILTIQLST